MEASVFTKIIRGDIPAYKIYENDKVCAFLDSWPAVPGHILVVPKRQVDRLEDLPDDDYGALMNAVKMLMQHVVAVFGPEYRACTKVEGFVVPHAHVHILPCRNAQDFAAKQDMSKEPDEQALEAMAKRLAV